VLPRLRPASRKDSGVPDFVIPVLFTTLLWWGSTGLVLVLVRARPETFQRSFGLASLLAVLALAGLWWLGQQSSVLAAYGAFTAGIVLWGWHEMAFLMGRITGTRRVPCLPGATGFLRFKLATQTVILHELALAATLCVLLLVCWGGVNQAGVLAFAILWILRLSAKINLFLGAINTGAEWLPPHLAYLGTYFRRRSMNGLFPFSILGALVLAGLLAWHAGESGADPVRTVSFTLLCALATLGLIEHIMMMLPLDASYPWRWFLQRRSRPQLHPKELPVEPVRASGTGQGECRT
jgi:putative photosynthetic complex assembly protein 2